MSSEKSILLPVTQLSSAERFSTGQTMWRSKSRPRFVWLRQYSIPILIAAAIHAGAVFWPTGPKSPVLQAGHLKAEAVQMIATVEAVPSPATAADSAPSSSGEPTEEMPSPVPPTLAEPFFEIASSLRQELGEYAKANMGNAGAAKLLAPLPGLDGSALAAFAGNWQGGATTFAPEPPYPPMARQEGREGLVELEVIVRHSGRVESAIVARTSGYADLDRAARETVVAKWRFPAGQPGHQYVRVSFRLTASERRH